MSVGVFAYLGLGVESSGGTPSFSASIVDYMSFVSETLAATREDIDSQELAQSPDRRKVYSGIQRVGGQIQVEAHPLTLGYLLRTAFDSTTTFAGGYGIPGVFGVNNSHAGVRTHKFTTRLGQFQSGSGCDLPCLTIEANRGPGLNVDSSFYYFNLATNVLEMTIEQGQLVRVSADMVGRDFGSAAKSTPAIPDAAAWLWSQASVSVDGVGASIFESLTFRLNNALEPINRIGSGLRADQVRRNNFREMNVNGTMGFDSLAQFDRFRAGSEGQMIVHFQGDRINAASNINNVLRLDVPKFRYSTHAINASGPGRIIVNFEGRGVLDTTSDYAFEVWVTNTRINAYTVNSAA